jgi:hypothetical protein
VRETDLFLPGQKLSCSCCCPPCSDGHLCPRAVRRYQLKLSCSCCCPHRSHCHLWRQKRLSLAASGSVSCRLRRTCCVPSRRRVASAGHGTGAILLQVRNRFDTSSGTAARWLRFLAELTRGLLHDRKRAEHEGKACDHWEH